MTKKIWPLEVGSRTESASLRLAAIRGNITTLKSRIENRYPDHLKGKLTAAFYDAVENTLNSTDFDHGYGRKGQKAVVNALIKEKLLNAIADGYLSEEVLSLIDALPQKDDEDKFDHTIRIREAAESIINKAIAEKIIPSRKKPTTMDWVRQLYAWRVSRVAPKTSP